MRQNLMPTPTHEGERESIKLEILQFLRGKTSGA